MPKRRGWPSDYREGGPESLDGTFDLVVALEVMSTSPTRRPSPARSPTDWPRTAC